MCSVSMVVKSFGTSCKEKTVVIPGPSRVQTGRELVVRATVREPELARHPHVLHEPYAVSWRCT